MAQYILKSDAFTAITETEGTLVNISNVPAEINLSGEFGTGIILFPHQHLPFAKKVYAARQMGGLGTAVVATIGTGGLQAESFDDDDIAAIFDDDTSSGFSQDDIDKIFEDDNFSDSDLDFIFSDDEPATDEDLSTIFDDDIVNGFSQDDIDSIFAA